MIYSFTKEQTMQLLQGQFQARKCLSCDGKGWYYVRDDGVKMNPAVGDDLANYHEQVCNFDVDECNGLGYHIIFNEG